MNYKLVHTAVIPIWDKKLPTITSCLDATFRRIGGVPAYVLTDNEKTVTTDRVAGIAVRNPEIVEVVRHYGTTIRTCLPADPETKRGSEATVRIAKADLVPKDVSLRDHYKMLGELEAACRAFCDEVNSRTHRAIRRRPVERLAEDRQRLHPLPRRPFTAAFGTTRRVTWESTISVEAVRYWVPHELIDTRVWARFHSDELIVTAVSDDGSTREVARNRRGGPGDPILDDARYPPRQDKESDRVPRAASAEEAFLALGPGAASWLVEGGSSGVRRIRTKMNEAVALSKLYSVADVDRALGNRRSHRPVLGPRPAVHPRLSGGPRAHRCGSPQRGPLFAARHVCPGLLRSTRPDLGSRRVRRKRSRLMAPHCAPFPAPAATHWPRQSSSPSTSNSSTSGGHWPTSSPQPRPRDGTPPKSSASFWPKKPQDATGPTCTPAARGPVSPLARPSATRSGANHPFPTQDALKTLEWIGRRENFCICGLSGTGKSHVAEALGQTVVEAGLSVTWLTIEDLGSPVRRHRSDDSIARALAAIIRSDLIMVDDIGLLPVSPDAAEGFYRLVDAAYERRSVAVRSNLHPSGFDEIMPKTPATATVDSLMHHAHIAVTQGDRYRLAEAASGQGVKPFS